jgi:cytochrome c oxidase subunit 4
VGLILGVLTSIEVAIYYMGIAHGVLVGFLLAFSAMKFVLVVLWFMHLRYDSRLFSTLFTGGMLLVMALFVVVLTTLSASLY